MRRHLPMIKFHMSVMSALMLAVACAVAGGIAYLSVYPYSLSYKKEEILAAINAESPDFNLDFEAIEISQFSFKPGVLIENAVITTHSSSAKIHVPRIELAYTFSNIWRLTAKPTSVRFEGARLVIDKPLPPQAENSAPAEEVTASTPEPVSAYLVPKPRPDGQQKRESVQKTPVAPPVAPEPVPHISESILNEAAQVLAGNSTGQEIASLRDFVANLQGVMKHSIWKVLQVETIAIDRAKIQFIYHGRKADVETAFFNVLLERPDAQKLTIAAFGRGSVEDWRLKLSTQRLSTHEYELATNIEGLRFHDLAPHTAWGKLDAPLMVESRMVLNTSGFVQSAALDAEVGKGQIWWDREKNITSQIVAVKLQAKTDENNRYLNIQPSTIQAEGLSMGMDGFIKLPHPDDQEQALGIVLQANDIRVTSPESSTPVILPAGHFRGAYELATASLAIDHVGVESPEIQASGAGAIDLSGNEPVMRFAGRTLNAFDAGLLKALWPRGLIPDARDWTLKNLIKATVTSTRFSMALTRKDLDAMANYKPIPADHFLFLASIADAQYRIEGTPAIVSTAGGDFQTAGSRFAYAQPEAVAEMPGQAPVAVKNLSYVIEDSSARLQFGRVKADLQGEIPTFVQFLHKSGLLQVPASELALLSRVKGQFAGGQILDFPLKPVVTQDELKFDFKAQISHLAVPEFWQAVSLEGASAEVAATNRQFSMSGKGNVLGISTPFQLLKSADSQPANITTIEATVTDALRQKLFPNTSFPFSGTTPIRIALGAHAEPDIFGLEVDLKQASLSLSAAGYEKKPGVPALFKCDRVKNDDGIVFENFSYDSAELAGKGTAQISPAGKLVSLVMPELSWGQAVKDSFALEMQAKDNKPSIKVVAKKMDARPFILKLTLGTASSGDDFKDMNFDLTARQALGYGNVTLEDVSIQAEKRNGVITALKMSAAKDGSPMLAGEIQKDGVGPFMFITSTNAGQILKFVNLSNSVRGGRLQFSEYLARGKQLETAGVLFLTDFQIEGDKTISGLTSSVPQQGDAKAQANNPDNNFEKLRLEFIRGPKEITISNSVMRGSSMGLTFEGVVDPNRDLLDITGTFVPFYGLNNAFSKIPILGTFLGGGDKNEGLLGVTYAVRGSINNSVLQINPMSAVAPGFLRRFFDFQPKPLESSK